MREILKAPRSGWAKPWKLALVLGCLAVVLACVAAWGLWPEDEYSYVTVRPHHAPLVVTVRASGTLEPMNTVKVGAELSGTIRTVHKDFNDTVRKGEVLARFDVTELQAQSDRLEAQLAMAVANERSGTVQLTEDRREYARKKKLRSRGVVSQKDLDLALYALQRSEAACSSRKSEVQAARAELRELQHKLAKADIVSPVDGLVLERKVEAGQAVASGFQTPELFILVSDLSSMKLLLNIDEADTGPLRVGQAASFRVDAYPHALFPATLTKLRYAPERDGGVVVYKAEFAVDNASLRLRPGMTATADITVAEVERALVVPNATLRFRPPEVPSAPGQDRSKVDGKSLWVQNGESIAEVQVRTGKTDGRFTEILDGVGPESEVVVSARRVE